MVNKTALSMIGEVIEEGFSGRRFLYKGKVIGEVVRFGGEYCPKNSKDTRYVFLALSGAHVATLSHKELENLTLIN